MTKILFPAFAAVLLLICFSSCAQQGGSNCFGVPIPDFKNPKVDSLVQERETIRCRLVAKIENGEEITSSDQFDWSNDGMRHMNIFEVLDKDGDQGEVDKYGEFHLKVVDKQVAWRKKMEKKLQDQ